MKRMIRVFSMMILAATLGLALSCSKDEKETKTVQTADPEEVALLENTIDELTRSLTAEDIAELGGFIRSGETPGTLEVLITKGEQTLVSGVVGRVSTENGLAITMDLLLMNLVPVVGNVVVLPLIKGVIEAALYENANPEKFAEAVALVNGAVNVTVMGTYEVSYVPAPDPETEEPVYQWCLVYEETILSIQQLVTLLASMAA